MDTLTEVYKRRDGMTEDEAQERANDLKSEFWGILDRPDADLEDIEGLLYGEGLELDYFEDLI